MATKSNADKDFMGLTTWTGVLPTRTDAEYAKNYLSEEEIDTLNLIVNLYLDFAELQAKSHTPVYMKDWLARLDDFLKLSGKDLLTHSGTVSAEVARKKQTRNMPSSISVRCTNCPRWNCISLRVLKKSKSCLRVLNECNSLIIIKDSALSIHIEGRRAILT